MSYTFNNTMIGDPVVTITGPNTTSTTYPYTTGGTAGGLTWGNLNGSSGQVYTSNGTNPSWITTDPSLKGASLSVKGDANFEGEVSIKGKNLTEMFAKIEERLAILHPNPELEDRWDELKELGKRYKELEQEIIEKEKVWNILKK